MTGLVIGLGVVAVALGLIVSLRAAGSPGLDIPSAAAVGSLEIRGLRAELIDGEKPAANGELTWWTTWRLCWDAVPGASDYLVSTVSFEGAGIPRVVTGTCYDLGVANGTTRESGSYAGRTAQLIQLEISMSVSVEARLPDGTVGPASPDIPVASTYVTRRR